MFCDLVGFTALCEGMTPIQVAALLNSFLTRMTDMVFEHEGTLDKFLGDALLAVFGAPFEQPDHPYQAVQAALGMRKALADLNLQLDQKLEMRIAISTGIALTGDIGSPKRREFTVLGDVVNTASRIEDEIAKPGRNCNFRFHIYARVKGRVQVRPLAGRSCADARVLGVLRGRGLTRSGPRLVEVAALDDSRTVTARGTHSRSAITCTTPSFASSVPVTPSSDAVRASTENAWNTRSQITRLTKPVSSSSVMNVTLDAVAGRWRQITRPA